VEELYGWKILKCVEGMKVPVVGVGLHKSLAQHQQWPNAYISCCRFMPLLSMANGLGRLHYILYHIPRCHNHILIEVFLALLDVDHQLNHYWQVFQEHCP